MPVRETFWNIPHWAEIGQYLLGLLTILIFSYGTIRRIRRWRKGSPERRTDQLRKRFWSVIVQAVGQIRTTQDRSAGVMHLLIFWGMVVLFFGTIVATIDWDVTHLIFDFQFLSGGVYFLFELILDIFGLLLLIGLGVAAYRRYILRPVRLRNPQGRSFAWDDAYAIVMLVLIAITGYLVEGLRIAVLQPEWASWSPVGAGIASAINNFGDPTNQNVHLALWIAHGLISLIFVASIPYSKLFHLIAAPVNIFFQKLSPPGTLSVRNWDGVKDWTDFSWKQILDFESCIRCGRCQDNCPAYVSGARLSPRDFAIKLEKHIWERFNGRSLHSDVITMEEIWACTTCMACSQVCPVFTELPDSIVDLRRSLVMEGSVDAELQDALSNLGRYGNSFGQSPKKRAFWSKSVKPRIKDARREPVQYLWFVGDYASYHPALVEITRKTAEVFQRANIDFGILYDAEQNAGNDVRRIGEEGLFELLVEKNVKHLSQSQYQAIFTTDPHSYNTLKNEYPSDVNGSRPILHYTELLADLIDRGQLKLNHRLGYRVTYQDPCYLGRYNGVYDSPRKVIEATGCYVIEMPRHHDRASCCGAGGGRIWMAEGEVKERPSETRIKEAVGLEGVDTFVTSCPKDVVMFEDAVKTTGNEERIQVKDLIELIAEAI